MTLALHPDGTAITCRKAVVDDQAYVAKTWTMALASAQGLSRTDAAKLVDRILNDAGTRVVIAGDAGDPRAIVGFLAYAAMPRTRCVHWVNVRKPMRRQGVMLAMARFAGLVLPALDAQGEIGKIDMRPLVYTLDGPTSAALLARCPATRVELEDVLS